MMDENTIFIAYIAWESGGKSRPVLLYNIESGAYRGFSITSQYNSNIYTHTKHYYEIINWVDAGLNMPSYVDTSELRVFQIRDYPIVGKLTDFDAISLDAFLEAKL